MALQAGKHVLYEKPVGEGRAEAEPLTASRRARPAAARRAVRPTQPDVSRALDGDRRRRHRAAAAPAGPLPAPRVPRGPCGSTMAASDRWPSSGSTTSKSLHSSTGPVVETQIAESTAVPIARSPASVSRCRGHGVQHARSSARGWRCRRSRHGAGDPAPHRRPALGVVLRHGGHGQPRRRLGLDRLRAVAQQRGPRWESHDSLDPRGSVDGLRELVSVPGGRARARARTICTAGRDRASRVASRERRARWPSSRASERRSTSASPRRASSTTGTTARPPDERRTG
jgi:hypothetical protein